MESFELTSEEQKQLLELSREAMEKGVWGERIDPLDLSTFPEALRRIAATFVTLTKEGNLRGCIGTLEARKPLIEDAREHAVAASLQDFRFPPVQPGELPQIRMEISILTPMQRLDYENPEDLVHKLRPGVDGVVLQDGIRRATFLPQVWRTVPNTEDFLSSLCAKMGASQDLWRLKPLDVFTYQVMEIHEKE
jgi:AmmeMemoRadiSam system protein A